jgi:hypothetical protein
VITLAPVFFLSSLDVATTLIVGGGFGTLAGAVNVTVVGCWFESAPCAAVHGAAAEVVGVVEPAGVVDVVNVQDHVTEVSVAPVTVAVRVTA